MRRAGAVGKIGIQSKGSAKESTLKKNKAKSFNKEYSFLGNSVTSGVPDNTGGAANPPVSGFPDSNLGDYVFTIEASYGGWFANFNSFASAPKSKIHVTNITDLNNIVHFTWTPPDSVESDFYNGNEMLIWGNDIYVIYKWSGVGSNYGIGGAANSNFVGFDNLYDSNGEFSFGTTKTGCNKLLKFVNCSIDEANEEILYDSYEQEDLLFFHTAHGNTVTDDYWILEERVFPYGTAVKAKIPLSGSISNWERIGTDPSGYDPAPVSRKIDVKGYGGGSWRYYNILEKNRVGGRYGDQITSSDKFIYSIGECRYTSDQAPPWLSEIGNPLVVLCRWSINGNDAEICHPLIYKNYSFSIIGRHHPTSFGDYIITTYAYRAEIILYKYNRKTVDLEIKYFTTIESGYVNNEDIVSKYNNLPTGEASISAENIYNDIIADTGVTPSTFSYYETEDYPDGNYVNLPTSHASYTDGTYIWMTTSSAGWAFRFNFDALDYDESIRVSDSSGWTDDICIAGDYLFLASEGGAKNLTYVQKDDFSSGATKITEASFTQNPFGIFYKDFIY